MEPRHHQVPEEAFIALASGHGGADAIERLIRIQYSRHVVLVRGVADTAVRRGHPEATRIRAAFDLLADVQPEAREAVDTVLRYPSVGAWALLALTGHADPVGLTGVAAAAAVRGGIPCALTVPAIGGRVTLPSLGQAIVPDSARTAEVRVVRDTANAYRAEIVADGRRIELPADPYRDVPGWHGLRRLTAGQGASALRLLLDDVDPHRFPGGTTRGRLSADETAQWQTALRDAWRLLNHHHRTTASEIGATIRVLTPLATENHAHLSATSPSAFGCTALSDPGDGLMLASTLAHEVQHAKLAALMNAVPLVRRDDTREYYAPWRDDPRPLGGLLQGAYAYLGVSGFWRRHRHVETGETAMEAHAEFARWREAAFEVTRTLIDSGGLTDAGQVFVAEMRGTLLRWRDEPVPASAASMARRFARGHRARWHQRNCHRM